MFCIFNVNGDPYKSECKFEDIDGKIWDSFTVIASPASPTASVNVSLAQKTSFFEYPIQSMNDIITEKGGESFDNSSTLSGSRSRLYFSSSRDNIIQHTLFFRNLSLAPGDTIISAHLQMMGSHPTDKYYSSFNVSAQLAVKTFEDTSTVQNIWLTSDDEKTVVEWDMDGDEWEVGEVWVSPDLKELIHAEWKDKTRGLSQVAIKMNGSTVLKGHSNHHIHPLLQRNILSNEDLDRAVYGIHEQLGFCVSPTLVIQVSRSP